MVNCTQSAACRAKGGGQPRPKSSRGRKMRSSERGRARRGRNVIAIMNFMIRTNETEPMVWRNGMEFLSPIR